MKRKYPAPNWKVGDTIYFKFDSSHWWDERVIVGETPRSWLVLTPGYSSYMADPKHGKWPAYCGKIPKCGYDATGNHWRAGTRRDKILNDWVLAHRREIYRALEYHESFGNPTHTLLRDLAAKMGLKCVESYPTEDTD